MHQNAIQKSFAILPDRKFYILKWALIVVMEITFHLHFSAGCYWGSILKVRNQDSLRQFGIIVETLTSPLVLHGEELEMERAWLIGFP